MLLEPFSTAPSSSSRLTAGLRNSDPLKNSPLGTTTVPPPPAAHSSIVDLIALVFSVVPSPIAPCWEISSRAGSAANAAACDIAKPATTRTTLAIFSSLLFTGCLRRHRQVPGRLPRRLRQH